MAQCSVEGGIALITINNPPVNALAPKVLTSIFEALRKAHADASVKAVVITGSAKAFSAGFDINEFASGNALDDRVNDAFCELVESGPKPAVAAVSGVALGGGCELAMACSARVATPTAKLGLPELQLGIIPGFGGTQRLPRLVGVQQAVQMTLTSKPIGAAQALKLGLVDAIAEPTQLLEKAKELALDMAAKRRPRLSSLHRTDKLEDFGAAMQIIEFARAQAAKQAKGLQHPQLYLDAVEAGLRRGGPVGLDAEAEAFAKAASLPAHKGLVYTFLARTSTQKVKGITDGQLKARPMNTVAVLGGGLMGSGIATACLTVGIKVILKEVNDKFLQAGIQRIEGNLKAAVRKKLLTEAKAADARGRLTGTLTYNGFDSVDLVIEAAIENVKIKQQIFADLEKACRKDAILATNTSTIDIELVAAKTDAQDRMIGAHFFSPAHIMPLLEIVRSKQTSPQVVLDVMKFGARIGKTCVVVGNCTGFAVNRVFFPYNQAACLLVDIGFDPYTVDKVIAGFGMPLGPFRLSDLVGADIGLHVGSNFLEEWPDRTYKAYIFKLMNDHKLLGEKTGAGFYTFEKDKRRGTPNPAVAPLIEESRKQSGLPTAQELGLGPKDIADFIFFPVINEACRIAEEGIVDKPSDLDISTVLGMGFPAPRGGPMLYGDLVGAKHVVARLQEWEKKFAPVGLAGFFAPSAYLKERAASGTPLTAGRGAGARL